MTVSPLVVGDPCGLGLLVSREIAAVCDGGTLAWDVTADLRDAADALAQIGWDALLVDSSNEPLSTAAMSHLSQIRGVPSVLVIAADSAALLEQTLGVATMAARHLPDVPVIVTGQHAADAVTLWAPVAEGLELHPTVVAVPDLSTAFENDPHQQMNERIA